MSPIFGPINSRRFGLSLGIDLSDKIKRCNFDCLYCELDPSATTNSRHSSVDLDEIISSTSKALEKHKDTEVLTITANGEPTLYEHLDRLIDELNIVKGGAKTLILSNGSNINEAKTRATLMKFDEVKLSLDCASEKCFKKLDRPHGGIELEKIIDGIKLFSQNYRGALYIETLFVKDINDSASEIDALNEILLEIGATRVDIGTVDRPPAYEVKALKYEELLEISKRFNSSLPIYIATRKKEEISARFFSEKEILDTLHRRPLTQEDTKLIFSAKSQKILGQLIENGYVYKEERHKLVFLRSKPQIS